MTQNDFGTVARIRSVSDDGRSLYFELRNGAVGTFNAKDDLGLKLGDVVLLTERDGESRIELGPSELWADEPWVGVVKLVLDDITVIDSGGRIRRVPTSSVPCEPENTVEAGDFSGVVRVLDPKPIRYIDLPRIDATTADRYIISADDSLPTFADFGGLEHVVRRARELIELSLRKRSELQAIGARTTKGILFTGPPGTGKTMLARIIAAESRATFFRISGPEVFSKWYGQSGEVLRTIFEAAASHDSAIVFFDEIDSVAGRRGDESHEESKRVVAQLLTLMDGFSADANVVVIATTNRLDDIDPALRRPGRFDWEIHFPMPSITDREAILRASSRHLKTRGHLPHSAIAGKSQGWSAADLAAIWTEAALLAVEDGRLSIAAEDYWGGFERVQRQLQDKVVARKSKLGVQ